MYRKSIEIIAPFITDAIGCITKKSEKRVDEPRHH